MIRRLLFWFSGHLPARIIDRRPGEPYLERYYVGQLLGWTFYLHRFVDGDGDEALHDHPWRTALALVLSGGYWEDRVARFDPRTAACVLDCRLRVPGTLNWLRRSDWHRITSVTPDTWTLFAHGPWLGDGWGFLRTTDVVRPPFDRARPGLLLEYDSVREGRPTPWWPTAPRGNRSRRRPYDAQARAAT